MRARRIVQAGAFWPDDLERLEAALELAWQQVRQLPGPREPSKTRETLAIIIVASGNCSTLDTEQLARYAVQTFLNIPPDRNIIGSLVAQNALDFPLASSPSSLSCGALSGRRNKQN
jgi:hypothetical protein